jgi:D-mannonate dehydratase
MPIVEVDQRWIEEMKSVGNVTQEELSVVVDDALRAHFFHLRQQKIVNERQFYEANHSEILQKYRGKFVAIHNETVIDADEDGHKLSKRVREQHGRIPIAIIEVRETPEAPTFKVRRPRLR